MAWRGEHSGDDAAQEAAAVGDEAVEHGAADALGMDVDDTGRMAADQGLAVDAGKGGVAGVDDQAGGGGRVGEEAVEVFGALDDGAQVKVIGELQPIGRDVSGDGVQARAEGRPGFGGEARRVGQGAGATEVAISEFSIR